MGMESGNGNDSQKMPDKGHHTIIQVGQVEFYSTMFICGNVSILSLNTLIEQSPALKYSNRTLK